MQDVVDDTMRPYQDHSLDLRYIPLKRIHKFAELRFYRTLRVRRSPAVSLLRLSRCVLCAWSQNADRVQRLDPRRNEETQFRSTLRRFRLLKQVTDNRYAAQARHLVDIDRVRIDEDSANHSRSSIRNEDLRRGGL